MKRSINCAIVVYFSLLVIPVITQAQDEEHIARSQFATAIASREPVDNIEVLNNDVTLIYFFNELRNLADRRITHRWEYQGRLMAEVSFEIGAPRWRLWSSKNLLPHQTGEWMVTIVDEQGNILGSHSFLYQEAGQVVETAIE